jgi:hypothetical protein
VHSRFLGEEQKRAITAPDVDEVVVGCQSYFSQVALLHPAR